MSVRILEGDALAMLRTLESESVQCVVCSPPYLGLRAYGTNPQVWGGDPEHGHVWAESARLQHQPNTSSSSTLNPCPAKDNRVERGHGEIRQGVCPCGAWRGELGLESSPALFIEHLVMIFDEIRRVLRPDGVCFVNLGDSYAGSGKGPTTAASTLNGGKGVGAGEKVVQRTAQLRQGFHDDHTYTGIPAKNLLLIPERFALAMQGFSAVPGAGLLQMADDLASAREADDWQMVEAVESQLRVWAAWSRVFDGWWVRSRIAWCKTSAMPESVVDRPTSAWEHIYMFTKSARYFWDQTAVRQPVARGWDPATNYRAHREGTSKWSGERAPISPHAGFKTGPHEGGANLRNFWLLGPEPSSLSHYASFVSEIPRRCIKAATSEKGACPACGAPWVRVVERERNGTAWINPKGAITQTGGKGTERLGPGIRDSSQTLGWSPGCTCVDAGPPVPCVVLDPFAGSGTTGLVASQLGRDAILIELSPEYAEMARRRIANDAPLLMEPVTVETPAAHQPDLFDALLPEHQAGPAPEMGRAG